MLWELLRKYWRRKDFLQTGVGIVTAELETTLVDKDSFAKTNQIIPFLILEVLIFEDVI